VRPIRPSARGQGRHGNAAALACAPGAPWCPSLPRPSRRPRSALRRRRSHRDRAGQCAVVVDSSRPPSPGANRPHQELRLTEPHLPRLFPRPPDLWSGAAPWSRAAGHPELRRRPDSGCHPSSLPLVSYSPCFPWSFLPFLLLGRAPRPPLSPEIEPPEAVVRLCPEEEEDLLVFQLGPCCSFLSCCVFLCLVAFEENPVNSLESLDLIQSEVFARKPSCLCT
jgi:hypothetical protein